MAACQAVRLTALLLALAAGCAPRLIPGPGATEVGGPGNSALTSRNGVTLVARTDVWQGDAELYERAIPLLVTVENKRDEPISVQHRNFQLFSDRGVAYWTMRPDVSGAMARAALPQGVLEPGGSASGFVYFERLPPGTVRVRLLADFDDPASGWRVARLGIPFVMLQREP